jgi:hypothetical protein
MISRIDLSSRSTSREFAPFVAIAGGIGRYANIAAELNISQNYFDETSFSDCRSAHSDWPVWRLAKGLNRR